MSAKRSTAKNEDGLSFEAALERLEGIVQRIESGDVGLEQAITEYEQGMALIRRCKEVLARAEQRVEELKRQQAEGDGGDDEE